MPQRARFRGRGSASDGPVAEELLGSDDGERSYHGSRGERDQEPADSADCEEDEDPAVRGAESDVESHDQRAG